MSDTTDYDDDDQRAPQAWGRPPGPWRPPHPGWGRPPTGVWPPCPPGPPGPWPGGLFRLEQCWDDVKATKRFLRRIIADLIAEDPSLIGLAQPIIGVTDGSDAQPGQVGEFVFFQSDLPVPVNAQSIPLSLGVLPPGDWDCWAYVYLFGGVHDIYFNLSPVPAGFKDTMTAWYNIGSVIPEQLTVNAPTTRALTSAPSLVVFQFATNEQGTGPAAIQASLRFAARRRR